VRACTRIAWLIGALLAATAAQGAVPPPTTVDCAAQPCAEVLPGAASFRPVEGAAYWEGVDADGDVVRVDRDPDGGGLTLATEVLTA